MSAETLLSAARRLLRLVRINNERDGGLISNDTSSAAEILSRMIEEEDRRTKEQSNEKVD